MTNRKGKIAPELAERPDAHTLVREAIAQERAEEWEWLLPKDLTEQAVRGFWAKEDESELHDAALLLEGIEPRPDRGLSLRKYLRGYDDRYAQDYDRGGEGEPQLVRLARIVRRARMAAQHNELYLRLGYGADGTQHEIVRLREFLRWARGKGYESPTALRQIIANVLGRVVDERASSRTERRRDLLSPAIENARQGTDGSVAAVWPELRRLALNEEPPFTGEVEGNSLLYTNSNNQSAKFTQDALRKRLGRTNRQPQARR